MDSLTHIVLGAVTGELLAGKKLGKKAMLWGAAANSLPDVDVLCGLFMNIPDELLAHRGLTHSLFFALAISPLLGGLFRKLYAKQDYSFKAWSLFFLFQVSLHDLIDWLTAYGTGLLEPFSHQRFALDVFFVADPFFSISLIIGFTVLLILRRSSVRRSYWAYACLAFSGVYLLYAFSNKHTVNKVLEQNIAEQNLSVESYITTPTPLNNFLWYIICRNDSGFLITHYSVFDKTDALQFLQIPRQDFLKAGLDDNHDLQKLIRFSQGYYRLEKIEETLVFSDMRFGQIGGWYKPDAPFVFRYKLAQNADNEMVIQRGRMDASNREALRELMKRIFRDK